MNNATEYYRKLDRTSLWHPYTRHSAVNDGFPVITRGEGVYLFDSDGNRYLDAISSWWACNLGHSHPRLIGAIRRQAGELQHSILGNLTHPGAAELAYKLLGTFPDRRRRVLFASDGASAVEAALRVAVQYRHNIGEDGRCRFVAFEDAYHGDTIGAMAVGYLPAFHTAYRPLLFPVHKVKTPDCSACLSERYCRDLRPGVLLCHGTHPHGESKRACGRYRRAVVPGGGRDENVSCRIPPKVGRALQGKSDTAHCGRDRHGFWPHRQDVRIRARGYRPGYRLRRKEPHRAAICR